MVKGRRNPSPRPNRSFQYANDDEIKKISFVVTACGVLTGSIGLAIFAVLVPSARRIFLFYVALNRSLKAGYRGTRSTQAALAEAIARATSAGMSVRTLQRGMKVLIAAGLIVETWFNLYDRKGQIVKYQRAAGEWETTKIRIYSLTPFALSLWAPPSKARKVSPVAASVGISAGDGAEVEASAAAVLPHLTHDKMTHHGNRIYKPSVSKSLVRVNADTTTGTTIKGNVVSSAVAADASTSAPSPAEIPTDAATGGKELSRGRPSIARGCSVSPPPVLQKNWPKNAANVRISLLAHVFHFLQDFPTRQADCLFLVAREETRPGAARRALPLCVDWGRVLSTWATLPRSQRWHVWRRDILPGLRSAVFAEPPDIERTEKADRKMAFVTGEMQARIDRAAAPVAPVKEQIAGRDERRDRIGVYTRQLKSERDPVQRALLTAAINALLQD